MCILFSKIVESIFKNHTIRTKAINDEDSFAVVESLTILMNIRAKEPTNQSKDYHFVGNLMN